MPIGLHRYQQEGDDHFITFSCYHRLPYLNTPKSRDIFLDSLENTHKRYRFEVLGYVVMPEHVHLLLSEPESEPLAKAIQELKVSVSKLSRQRPFWQNLLPRLQRPDPQQASRKATLHASEPSHTWPIRSR